MSKIRLVITGSRHLKNYDRFCASMKQMTDGMEIVEVIAGGATGADQFAKDWAEKKGLKFSEYKADWKLFGKGAGPIRNSEMAIVGNATIAFPLNGSKGTWDMITQARIWKHEAIIICDYDKGIIAEVIDRAK